MNFRCFQIIQATTLAVAVAAQGASAKDASTSNAEKVDDASRSLGTQVKTYEQKTDNRRSLRHAADSMLDAAKKDRAQTSPANHQATNKSVHADKNVVQRTEKNTEKNTDKLAPSTAATSTSTTVTTKKTSP